MLKNLKILMIILIALIPSTVLMFILLDVFPYTGLGRILTIPMTYFMNLGIIGLGFLAVRRFKDRHVTLALVWGIVVFLTLVITVWVYPQEGAPRIINQIWD